MQSTWECPWPELSAHHLRLYYPDYYWNGNMKIRFLPTCIRGRDESWVVLEDGRTDGVDQERLHGTAAPLWCWANLKSVFPWMTVNIRDPNKSCWATFHSSRQPTYWLCEWRMSHVVDKRQSNPESHLVTIWQEHGGGTGLAPACLGFVRPRDVHLECESDPSCQRRKVLHWNRSITHIPPGIHILVTRRACAQRGRTFSNASHV